MDREQAKNLIKDTFEQHFNKNKFYVFIKNLLNYIEDAHFTYRGNYIPAPFKQHVSTLERIGKYSDGEHRYSCCQEYVLILLYKLKEMGSFQAQGFGKLSLVFAQFHPLPIQAPNTIPMKHQIWFAKPYLVFFIPFKNPHSLHHINMLYSFSKLK